MESRRLFLKKLALALASPLALAEVQAKKSDATKPNYKISEWTGDDFTLGHKLRSGDVPALPADTQKKVDFVIVGGGLAGLTAAYNLKDHDYLLLEQYESLGGQSRGGSYRGIDYSWAAAYVGTVDGYYGELYSALGLEAVKLEPERNSWYWRERWFSGVESKKSVGVYSEFKKLIKDCKPVWDKMPEGTDVDLWTYADLRKLDNTMFASNLTGYSEQFTSLIDNFCKSAFCGGINNLSSLAGYALLSDLVLPTYTFKGGNPAIARGLVNKINTAGAGRLVSDAFVWKIEMNDKGASVFYGRKDGSVNRVDCKYVIVATPPMVAARQLVHAGDDLKAQLLGFKYGSYLVANLLMKKRLFNQSYDNFLGSPFTFADFTVAETPYLKTNSYKEEMGSVLTVYQPYPPGSQGRTLLLVGNRQEFAFNIFEQMQELVKDLGSSLEEVVLSRWGHAMAIVSPGYFGRLEKLHSLTNERLCLAHSSVEGWPAAECAIRAGKRAAAKALALKN